MEPEARATNTPAPGHGHRRRPPLPNPIGRLLEPLYRAAINRRNRAFDAGKGVTRFEVPVVSVGNLSVGGTGKSPMVAHVVGALLRAGRRPCIAMRGYTKGRRRGLHAPDETDAYRRAFAEVAIVAQPDRTAGLRALLKTSDASRRPDCIVLDDGFQHRQIARDLDIVLIDASRPPFTDLLLPAGWLRESAQSLERASLVALTHAELVDKATLVELDRLTAAERAGLGVDAVTRHAWTGLLLVDAHCRNDGAVEQVLPLDWLLGKRVVASCAVGNPEGFLHSLRVTLGTDTDRPGELADALILPDHDPYHPQTVRSLVRMAAQSDADAIVVTDKDWSKLRHLPAHIWGEHPVVRPQLSLVFDRGGPGFDQAVLAACRLMP